MKRIFLYAALSLVLFSCRNGVETEKGSEPLAPRPKVAKCIEQAFSYFIEHETDSSKDTIYSMEFVKGLSGFPADDTLIVFFKRTVNMSKEGFRGYITLNDYQVLIFDKDNIGECFYDSDSLKDIDVHALRLSSQKIVLGDAYILNGSDHLNLTGYNPHDFLPIKIDRLNTKNSKRSE